MSEPTSAHLILKRGRAKSIHRQHCWIFSGAIYKVIGKPGNGDYIDVLDAEGAYLCSGHYQNGSIALRIISHRQDHDEIEAIREKLILAIQLRRNLGFIENEETNAFRLIHGEGDRLPGLIIDIYHGCAIVQPHSLGMLNASKHIAAVLKDLAGDWLNQIYVKPRKTNDKESEGFYAFGEETAATTISENGKSFHVNWEEGQKTGFFLDQRDNRALVSQMVENKRVLNAFCYSGGFSVYALQGGAELVHSVDASQKAMEWTEQNVKMTGLGEKHQSYTDDVMAFLKETPIDYDMVILDPPAFAKSQKSRHRAVQGYKRLNMEGIKKVKPGGLLLTFSCSQVVDRALFQNTIVAAALESGRDIRILKSLEQGSDHPVNIYHQEGAYLKGLLLYVGGKSKN